ncbi:Aldehyde dehydrogenase family 3 member H1 [Dichanthelium oligosanthes]|uniref:Aldehyde dehydrogenase n=1 Tax=Dichanthelium oligosanthes TaxID=888268 RepID=A0A1E5VS54_9POAL|nr:Aldehyde dehydrogenase family 3 member H1 [Dichanthelium oligosanthes]
MEAVTVAAEAREQLRASFSSGRTRPAAWRAAQLRGLLRMAAEMEAEICAALRADLAKPRTESYVHEISLVTSSCKFALKNLEKWMKPEKLRLSLMAFLKHLLAVDPVIGAIAAGNAVVLKPSEIAPATSTLLADLLPRYVDSSCIKVVEGGIPETTALLEQKWDKIFYTGNSKVGRIVMSFAAKHLTPVVLELGGKCPVVVDSNVDLHVTAKRIAAGKWGCNNGQACISPDYIITTKSFAPKMLDSLRKVLDKFYGKDPLRSADLSRIVNSNHFNRLKALMDEEMVSDKIVFGGQSDEQQLKIAPTLLLDAPLDSAIMKEEIFGPLLPIITVDKIHESFALINSMTKPLAAYLFSKDSKLKHLFERNVSAGGMIFNDTGIHLTNQHLPFGGVGESGMGAYHGTFSFDSFAHRKAVLDRSFLGEAKARYPPYTLGKLKILKGVLKGNPLAMVQAALGCTGGA